MSSTTARCEHNRIHRDHTDIDKRNKCQVEDIPVWTPKPKNTTTKSQTSQAAPQKRGRGRPRKQDLTPPREDQDSISNDDDDTSGFPSSPLASFVQHPIRALGSLFTPNASQQESAAMLQSKTPNTDDAEAPSSPDGLRYTPSGNAFVPETPLDDMPAVAGDDDSVFEGMSSAPNTQPAPVVYTSVLAAWEHDVVQYENEIDHLQRSRAKVIEELADSSGLAKRLRTRTLIYEATHIVTKTELAQTKREREAADEQARQAEQVKLHLGSLVVVLVLLMVAYGLWCWYKTPEMEYIRQRRVAVLHE